MKRVSPANKAFFLLLLIFFIALFLRLYRLNSLPFNFHEDEVLGGYVGRFILQNGKDLYGNPWPLLYFNKFGDYYIILPMYLSGLATYIFGINEFAIRLPVALFGSLIVFPVYILALWVFRSKIIALLSAFFIAVSPWQIVLSRTTTEGIIGCFIYLTGIVVFLNSVQSKSIYRLIISSLIFFLSYWIYHPFRIYVPLTFLPIFFLFKEVRSNKKYLVALFAVTVFFFSLTFYISKTPWGSGRFIQTSIFSPLSGVNIKIEELIADEGRNAILKARLFHNKFIGYGLEFIAQYLTYFSPLFLFINGWEKSRYAVPLQGPLFITFFILIIISIIPVKTKPLGINTAHLKYLIYLLLISIIPAALTVAESPNVHRALFMSIPLSILAAVGFNKALQINYKNVNLSLLIAFLLTMEFIYFWHQYSIHVDLHTSHKRNDGQKQLSLFVHSQEKIYDEIFLPAEAGMSLYYLFFNKDFNPAYASQFKLDTRIKKTGKIIYVENSCPSQTLQDIKRNILVIDRGSYQCIKDDRFDQIALIKGVNDLLAFKVLVPKK